MDIELSAPGHITADFVGEPGQRTFYLQAEEEAQVVSLLVEKDQVSALAEVLVRLLAEVGSEPAAIWDIEDMRLREPVVPRWRAGAISVGLEPQLGRFLIELREFVPEDEPRQPEEVRVWLTEEQAQVLAAHATWAVEQGRPQCRLCGQPLEPDSRHVCPRGNGDARARNPDAP